MALTLLMCFESGTCPSPLGRRLSGLRAPRYPNVWTNGSLSDASASLEVLQTQSPQVEALARSKFKLAAGLRGALD